MSSPPNIVTSESTEPLGVAALVILTHEATAAAIQQALVEVAAIDTVVEVGTFLRVTG